MVPTHSCRLWVRLLLVLTILNASVAERYASTRVLLGKKEGGYEDGSWGGGTQDEEGEEEEEEEVENRVDTPSPTAYLIPSIKPTESPTALPSPLSMPSPLPWPDISQVPSSVSTPTTESEAPLSQEPSSVIGGSLSNEPSLDSTPMQTTSEPSNGPSQTPTNIPSQPSSTPTASPTTLSRSGSSPAFQVDPTDPSKLTCRQDAEAVELSNAIDTLPIEFVYQLWIESTVDFDTTLETIEIAMAQAAAEALLSCPRPDRRRRMEGVRVRRTDHRRRRLMEGIRGVSAMPADAEQEACDTDCHRMNGFMTFDTVGVEGGSTLVLVCAALEFLRDPATLTRIATTVAGVEALRFEGSNIWCGSDVTDSLTRDSGDNNMANADSSLGTGATLAVAMASLIVVVSVLVVARRSRRRQLQEASDAETNKDFGSLYPTSTMQTSPSSAVANGQEYTILADTYSFYELDESPSQKNGEPLMTETQRQNPPTTDLFRLDQTDLPGWLQQQTSEVVADEDEDEDEDTLIQWAQPAQLASDTNRLSRHSSPRFNFVSEPSMAPIKEDAVASPSYIGIASLLGATDSEELSIDDEPAVVQILQGDVHILKLSDLSASNFSVGSEESI